MMVDFGTLKAVNCITYVTGWDTASRDPMGFNFYGSSDNATWTLLNTQSNITNTSSRSYQMSWCYFNLTNRYYKFEVTQVQAGNDGYIGINEIYIGYNGVKLDYTGATAVSLIDNGYTGEPAAYAINGVGNLSKWTAGWSSSTHPTMMVDFGMLKAVNCITYVTGYDTASRDPMGFHFYGSTDNATWTLLNTQSNITNTTNRNYQMLWYSF